MYMLIPRYTRFWGEIARTRKQCIPGPLFLGTRLMYIIRNTHAHHASRQMYNYIQYACTGKTKINMETQHEQVKGLD